MHARRVKAEETTFGELNVSQGGRKVFLVKLPAYVSKEWDNLRPNSEIGRVLIPDTIFEEAESPKGGTTPNDIRESKKRKRDQEERKLVAVSGKLVLTAPQFSASPKEHTLLFAPTPVPTFAFTETDKGVLNVEGRVPSRWDCRPVMTKEYRSVLQSRENYEKTKQRPIQTISLDEAPSKMARQKQKVRKTEPVQDKMTRMPKQELINLIFACFSKQDHWNLKHLREATEQPTAWLKEILGELCVYTKKGPNKNTFELKPEYKGAKKGTDSPPKKEK